MQMRKLRQEDDIAMTRVRIESGICGFSTLITAEKLKAGKIRITIESECEMVRKMEEDFSILDLQSLFSGFLNNPVHKSAACRLKHVACPVPSGILKAAEAEMGLSIPRDAHILFLKE
jgi:hypothetical protein